MATLSVDPAAPTRSHSRPRQSPRLWDELVEEIVDPDQIVTNAPSAQFRLGYLDVTCLILNHVIGSGIFNSPGQVMKGTNSTGAGLLLWFVGIVVGLCGVHVYVEYGLNVPRYVIDGEEKQVPRSGGDLHYLHYVFRRPRYKENTVLFFPCVYGIAFICLGSMAGNSVSFAARALKASHPEEEYVLPGGTVRGIAIAAAFATCFIHTISRRGGIVLNNIIALVKVGILLLIIFTAIAVSAGGISRKNGEAVPSVFDHNLKLPAAFDPIPENPYPASGGANGYAQAFLAIIFAYSGFNQTNYVLGEVNRPRKTYPISMMTGALVIAVLYMAVNVCYMVVVPMEDQVRVRTNVAEEFFKLTYGALGNEDTGVRIFNAFLAISSLGNLIVMTFTAARMKQEIAKQGFLPFAKFFAQDYDLSLGRLLLWLRTRGWLSSVLRHKWLSPEAHTEKTPVGAFILHLASCIVLILATWGLSPDGAYELLTSAWVYLFPAVFGFFLAAGILILRFSSPPEAAPISTELYHPHDSVPGTQAAAQRTWTSMTGRSVNPTLSVVCAVVYLLGSAYPVIVSWVPPPTSPDPSRKDEEGKAAWFVIPAVSVAVLGFGALWFLGFLTYAKRREHRRHQEFVIERYPEFEWAEDDGGDAKRMAGGLVLVHETVSLLWKGRELGRMMRGADDFSRMDRGTNGGAFGGGGGLNGLGVEQRRPSRIENTNPFAGTDFEGMGR
ncbi:related to high affinity methionine permease [Cephalotrichum gorgonifer]|uniref:Related to high affinity methionine permease n=1 Tax=Cephalotrichum gorgonifer TaxID=2041049 RepID=A0AAE8MSV3_9PEZI|nr:related to high affinity methionine permease [Cephalotrichum gorgonifer]